jgi:hypothetical protein
MKINFDRINIRSYRLRNRCKRNFNIATLYRFKEHINTIRDMGIDFKSVELCIYADSILSKINTIFLYVEKIPLGYVPERHIPDWYQRIKNED